MTLTLRKRPEPVEAEAPRAAVAEPMPFALRLPSVNLLPLEIQQRRRFRDVKLGLAGAAVASVGLVALLYVGAVGSVSDATAELGAATSTGAQLTAETTKYHDVTAVYQQAAAAKGLVVQAMGDEIRFSQVLGELSTTLPDHVWLDDVSMTQTSGTGAPVAAPVAAAGTAATSVGTVTFTGTGFSHDDVASWLDALGGKPTYGDPYLSQSTEKLVGPRKVVSFSSTATLTPAALSGRFTKDGG